MLVQVMLFPTYFHSKQLKKIKVFTFFMEERSYDQVILSQTFILSLIIQKDRNLILQYV